MRITTLFRSSLLVAAALAVGCDNTTNPPLDDLAKPHDMAGADKAGPPDMATGGDMAGADLAMTMDMAMTADMAMGPDLRPSLDMAMGPDMATLPDMTVTPSTQIQAVRDAADMPPDGGVGLPVQNVLVTYTKVLIGTDAAGFFVQADPMGPALFVAVDPTTLNPVPAVGDKVSFQVDAVTKAGGLREATAVSMWMRASQGNSVAGLIQDVSAAADLVTAVDNYESELVKATATVTSTFAASGAGFVQAGIDTAGVAGNANLKLRLPISVRDDDDVAMGCVVKMVGSPMWRFNAAAQVSGWVDGDLTTMTCPAPKVVSAVALSSTTVQVTFDRLIDPASVHANGDQFTFDMGLTASAAAAPVARTIVVTTAAQTGGTTYKVTVAATVTDKLAMGIDATANSASFSGFQMPAVLRINEVNPAVTGGFDLMELYAVSGGSTSGLTVVQAVGAPTTVATLPNLNVATGDLIMLHFNNPAGVTTELNTKGDCANAACYAGAWDVLVATGGLTFSHRVLWIKTAVGGYMDAVAFADVGIGNPPAAYPADVQTVQAANAWLPKDCGGALCTYVSNPTVVAISVDWSGCDSAATMSVHRKANMDSDQATDWALGAQTFGATNP